MDRNSFASSLPNSYVGDLLFHQHARVLRAGTRNRGVWEIPVDGWMTEPDLRSPVGREPCREPDPAVVHLQLARDLAHDLDGDANDRPAGAPQVHWNVAGRTGIRRVRHLLDYRHRTSPPPRSTSRAATAF